MGYLSVILFLICYELWIYSLSVNIIWIIFLLSFSNMLLALFSSFLRLYTQ